MSLFSFIAGQRSAKDIALQNRYWIVGLFIGIRQPERKRSPMDHALSSSTTSAYDALKGYENESSLKHLHRRLPPCKPENTP